MLHKSYLAAAAILVATPLFAQGHGGGGGQGGPPAGSGSPAAATSQGPMNASPMGMEHASPNSVLSSPQTTQPTTTMPVTTTTQPTTTTNYNSNSPAAQNSQGPAHASPTGISHANENSVLARGAVSSANLPGLTTGLTVNNSTGTSIGTVSRVVTGSDGSIRQVIVVSPTGKTMKLAPSTLSISGNVVTTTSTSGG